MYETQSDRLRKCDKYSSFVLSITAIVIAGIALAISVPRLFKEDNCGNVDLGIDYLGIIIGLLALMVTLMVAWNIWQTMEAKRSIDKFEEKTNNYDKDLTAKVNEMKTLLLHEVEGLQDKTKSEISETESYIRGFVASDVYHKLQHLHSLIPKPSSEQTEPFTPFDSILYDFLYHSIKSLMYAISGSPDVSYCNSTLETMTHWLNELTQYTLDEDQKARIYNELDKIEPKIGKLHKFKTFKSILVERFPPF